MTEITDGADFRKQQQSQSTVNILVTGITGSGKSTLVNALFGSETTETQMPIQVWDTVGLELNSSTTESIAEIKKAIVKESSSKDPFERIHCIWYCINSGSNKYKDAEISFIKELYSTGVPILIVLTQCWTNEEEVNNFEKKIRRINAENGLDNIDVVQVLAQEMKMRGLPPIPAFGLDTLIDATMKKYLGKTKSDFLNQARSIIDHYAREIGNFFLPNILFMQGANTINVLRLSNTIDLLVRSLGELFIESLPRILGYQFVTLLYIDFTEEISLALRPPILSLDTRDITTRHYVKRIGDRYAEVLSKILDDLPKDNSKEDIKRRIKAEIAKLKN